MINENEHCKLHLSCYDKTIKSLLNMHIMENAVIHGLSIFKTT